MDKWSRLLKYDLKIVIMIRKTQKLYEHYKKALWEKGSKNRSKNDPKFLKNYKNYKKYLE